MHRPSVTLSGGNLFNPIPTPTLREPLRLRVEIKCGAAKNADNAEKSTTSSPSPPQKEEGWSEEVIRVHGECIGRSAFDVRCSVFGVRCWLFDVPKF